MESSQRKYSPNPRDNASILSIIFFAWTLPLFKKGYEKVLQIEDMFQPLNADHSKLLGDRLEKWVAFVTFESFNDVLAQNGIYI